MTIKKREPIETESYEPITAKKLLSAYARGNRDFRYLNLDGIDLSGTTLRAASFLGSSMRRVNLAGADLLYAQLKSCDCSEASFYKARIGCSDLIGAKFTKADFGGVDFTGACFSRADCRNANFSSAWLNNANVDQADFTGAKLSKLHLSSVNFSDLDLRPFCNSKKLSHSGPSHIDALAVMKSHSHSNLKQFMIDCGVPDIFATYMIDCARAMEEPLLKMLMQSTFISYGGPDEKFARKIYTSLRAHKVVTFFFPESAMLGERIDNEVFKQLKQHDRVILICSINSLDRPGVIHEIQETLDREARDGGETYLLPIMLDDYVLRGWSNSHPELAERVRRRIIGDFRKTKRSKEAFDAAMSRLLDALKKSAVHLQ